MELPVVIRQQGWLRVLVKHRQTDTNMPDTECTHHAAESFCTVCVLVILCLADLVRTCEISTFRDGRNYEWEILIA